MLASAKSELRQQKVMKEKTNSLKNACNERIEAPILLSLYVCVEIEVASCLQFVLSKLLGVCIYTRVMREECVWLFI